MSREKTEMIGVRVDRQTYEMFRDAAKADGRPISNFVLVCALHRMRELGALKSDAEKGTVAAS